MGSETLLEISDGEVLGWGKGKGRGRVRVRGKGKSKGRGRGKNFEIFAPEEQ